jgi:formiminotetrahydrofolate cyclodeaminase
MADQFLDTTIGDFLDRLASSAPTPGGGSVAAMTGAMAAGLIVMVCDLTIGKKQYADFEDEARNLRAQAESLRHELQRLAQEDIAVFDRLSAAYKLPRTTDADAASRKAAIQQVTRLATEVPLQIARASVNLLPLCPAIARQGNRMLISDLAVALLLIKAAVPSALFNVEINLNVIDDQNYVRQVRAQMVDLTVGLNDEVDGVLAMVRERMAAER